MLLRADFFGIRIWSAWLHAHCREREILLFVVHKFFSQIYISLKPLGIPCRLLNHLSFVPPLQVLGSPDETHLQRVASDLCVLRVPSLFWRHIFTLSNRELLICCAHALCSTAAGIAFSSWNEQPENFVTAIATKPLLKVTVGVNSLLPAFAAHGAAAVACPAHFPALFHISLHIHFFVHRKRSMCVTISHAVSCWSGAQGFEALQMTHYEMADDISHNGLLARHCFPHALPSCLNKKVEAI
jgi:hypothetical protein